MNARLRTSSALRGLLAAFASSLFLASLCGAEELTVVADEWCPYNCAPNAERKGVLIEIAEKIFAAEGITIKYTILPWARAIEQVREGKSDALVGAARTDAPDFIFPEPPPAFAGNVFVVEPSNSWRYTGIESLQNVSLGIIQDYSYGEEIDGYINANKNNRNRIQIVSGDDGLRMNLRKLLAKRVDVILDDRSVIDWTLKANPEFAAAKIVGEASPPDGAYIAFSPAHAERSKRLADLFATKLKALQQSGEVAKIAAHYR